MRQRHPTHATTARWVLGGGGGQGLTKLRSTHPRMCTTAAAFLSQLQFFCKVMMSYLVFFFFFFLMYYRIVSNIIAYYCNVCCCVNNYYY